MIKYSIIIPCYNEGDNIPLLVKKLHEISRPDLEFILVDNGSHDSSKDILANLNNSLSLFRSIRIEKNIGYGHGIKKGLESARGDFLGWTHADLQTDPNDILKCIHIIEAQQSNEKNIYIKGSRKGRPVFDTFFTFCMGLFETLLFGTILLDINAQPNIFHRSLYKKWISAPNDFSLDLYALIMAKRNNIKISRIEVEFPERMYGQSSWNFSLSSKLKFIKRTLKYSLQLRKEKLT